MRHKRKMWLLFARLLLILIIFVLPNKLGAQNFKVSVSGGAIQFTINSLSQYNGGVSLVGWTNVKIRVNDTDAFDGWQLYVIPSFPNLMSDDTGNPDLTYDYLKLVPIGITNTNTSCVVNSSYSLMGPDYLFMSGDGDTDATVTFSVTYELGKDVPLINVPWGYYYSQLEFRLVSIDQP